MAWWPDYWLDSVRRKSVSAQRGALGLGLGLGIHTYTSYLIFFLFIDDIFLAISEYLERNRHGSVKPRTGFPHRIS